MVWQIGLSGLYIQCMTLLDYSIQDHVVTHGPYSFQHFLIRIIPYSFVLAEVY